MCAGVWIFAWSLSFARTDRADDQPTDDSLEDVRIADAKPLEDVGAKAHDRLDPPKTERAADDAHRQPPQRGDRVGHSRVRVCEVPDRLLRQAEEPAEDEIASDARDDGRDEGLVVLGAEAVDHLAGKDGAADRLSEEGRESGRHATQGDEEGFGGRERDDTGNERGEAAADADERRLGTQTARSNNVNERDDCHSRRVGIVDLPCLVDLLDDARKIGRGLAQPANQKPSGTAEDSAHDRNEHPVRHKVADRGQEELLALLTPHRFNDDVEDDGVGSAYASTRDANEECKRIQTRAPRASRDQVRQHGADGEDGASEMMRKSDFGPEKGPTKLP